ncbi:MAG: translation elongation factor Ts [Planctomycetes bacterium]|nr:translation elongation factor Ts [Planctomycetota bacterium]
MTDTISATQVRDLRERTGAGLMECKRMLQETGGDIDKAIEQLRVKGIAKAAKKADRDVSQGLVQAYIHHNGKVGVLLEVNCETDFVAATDAFKDFCKDVSLHIASMKPLYLKRDEVPAEAVEAERAILAQQVDTSKPAEIQAKMIEGRLAKFYAESCLLDQAFVKDDKKTVEQYRAETVGKLGENIQIRRFARFEIGV